MIRFQQNQTFLIKIHLGPPTLVIDNFRDGCHDLARFLITIIPFRSGSALAAGRRPQPWSWKICALAVMTSSACVMWATIPRTSEKAERRALSETFDKAPTQTDTCVCLRRGKNDGPRWKKKKAHLLKTSASRKTGRQTRHNKRQYSECHFKGNDIG